MAELKDLKKGTVVQIPEGLLGEVIWARSTNVCVKTKYTHAIYDVLEVDLINGEENIKREEEKR